jgi:hypothetical protein
MSNPPPVSPVTTPGIPGLPFLNNGMPSNQYSWKRKKSFLEIFKMGLDQAGPVVPLPFKTPKPKVKIGSTHWTKVIKEPSRKKK